MEILDNSAFDLVYDMRSIPGVRANKIDSVQDVLIEKVSEWQETGANPPRLITSVGGSAEVPSVVAPANIVTGLEVLKRFNEREIPASFSVRFASQYAVDANGIEIDQATLNAWQTAMSYASFIDRFYPDLRGQVDFEVEQTDQVEQLPEAILKTVGYFGDEPSGSEELNEQIAKLTRYGKARNPDITKQQSLRYLLSHTTIFEDVIRDDQVSNFVIKVGSPSEQQFSEFQRRIIEDSIALGGLVSELANPTRDRVFNQLSIFGPRVGSRPPYYKQDDIEIDVVGAQPWCDYKLEKEVGLPEGLKFEQRRDRLAPLAYKREALGNTELEKRYKQLFGLLAAIGIKPSQYENWLTKIRKDLGGKYTLRLDGNDFIKWGRGFKRKD